MFSRKQTAPTWESRSGHTGKGAGAAFELNCNPIGGLIASGDLWAIYGRLLDLAYTREKSDPNPARRRKHGRLPRYLTLRLARLILREEGRR